MRERTNNDLTTPEWLLRRLWALGAIMLDPCSNPWSEIGACIELSTDRGQDGLTADWGVLILERKMSLDAGGYAFVNPPYGRGHMGHWMSKIAQEAAKGVEVVALVPTSTDTSWWRTLRASATARVDLEKRIAFGGGNSGTGTFASTLFYCGARPYWFAHHFADLGEVHLYASRVKHASPEPKQPDAVRV